GAAPADSRSSRNFGSLLGRLGAAESCIFLDVIEHQCYNQGIIRTFGRVPCTPPGAANMTDPSRLKALDNALSDLTKRFGDGAIVRLGDAAHLQVDVIPTGSLAVDLALGVGGIPRGRVTEVYGPESSGKTTL